MWCPDCHGIFACPCKHCVARDTENRKTWIRIDGGESQACPDCGFSAHLDTFLDIEMDQYKFLKRLGFYRDESEF